jgi:hypothetical protein
MTRKSLTCPVKNNDQSDIDPTVTIDTSQRQKYIAERGQTDKLHFRINKMRN